MNIDIKNIRLNDITEMSEIASIVDSYVSQSLFANTGMTQCDQLSSSLRSRLIWNRMSTFQKGKSKKKFMLKMIIQLFKLIICTCQAFLLLSFCSEISFFERHVTQESRTWFQPQKENWPTPIYSRYNLVKSIEISFQNFKKLDSLLFKNIVYNQTYYDICFIFSPSKLVDININIAYVFGKNCFKINDTDELNKHINQVMHSNIFPLLQSLIIQIQFTNRHVCHNAFPFINSLVTFDITGLIENIQYSGMLYPKITVNTVRLHVISPSGFMYTVKQHFGLLLLNVIEIILSILSLFLCIRSLISRIKLFKFCKNYFNNYRNYTLKFDESMEFVETWLIIFFINDILSMIVSFTFILMLLKFDYYTNIINIGVGINSFLAWIGILRYFMHFSSFNFLLIILKNCMTSVIRFISCTIIVYIPCVLFAYCNLGPYNEKFSSLWRVAALLFALMNGDEMLSTYELLNDTPPIISIVSKIFLTIFIFFFMYVVISIFIAIINDSRNKIQINPNIITKFIEECQCSQCTLRYDRHPIII